MKAQRFVVYLRQPDRRLYPCIALRDAKGIVALHAAPVGQRASTISAAEAELLESFRGVENMCLKTATGRSAPMGRWVQDRPQRISYMMSRPDVPCRVLDWGTRYARFLERNPRAEPPLFDPHTLSGLDTSERGQG